MNAAEEVGIGIVGYGTMGKAHSYGYAAAPHIRSLRRRPRLRVISGRNRPAVERAARDFGAERAVTDWRELVSSPDVPPRQVDGSVIFDPERRSGKPWLPVCLAHCGPPRSEPY